MLYLSIMIKFLKEEKMLEKFKNKDKSGMKNAKMRYMSTLLNI
jgi:hypothetical protein